MMDSGYILEKDLIFQGLSFCKDEIWDTILDLFLVLCLTYIAKNKQDKNHSKSIVLK